MAAGVFGTLTGIQESCTIFDANSRVEWVLDSNTIKNCDILLFCSIVSFVNYCKQQCASRPFIISYRNRKKARTHFLRGYK